MSADDVLESAGTCFVAQPFDDNGTRLYRKVLAPAIEAGGLNAVRADDSIFSNRPEIVSKVADDIRESSVVLCDITTLNANVLYELGLAHAWQKPVIMITTDPKSIPFDLRHLGCIIFDTSDPDWKDILIGDVTRLVTAFTTEPEAGIPHQFRSVDMSQPVPPQELWENQIAELFTRLNTVEATLPDERWQ